jgi:hypothetical protein
VKWAERGAVGREESSTPSSSVPIDSRCPEGAGYPTQWMTTSGGKGHFYFATVAAVTNKKKI